MQITLEITPEAQAELSRRAAISGRGPEVHAATLLEEALHVPLPSQLPELVDGVTFGQRLVAVCAMISGLTEDVDFSRDSSTWRPLDLS